MSRGIVAYGAYVPYFRLRREAIGAALGTSAGKGTRAVAAYDEDATSMGVEASRAALAAVDAASLASLWFATTAPAYLDKTNANAIHAALNLDPGAFAVDLGGAVRGGVGALRAAASATGAALAVLADVRGGLPASADEREGGDAAVAFVMDSGDDVIAEFVGMGSATDEFLDRWRIPGEQHSRVWEERFGEQAYLPLLELALADALKQAGLAADAIDHFVIAGSHGRAVRRAQAVLASTATVAEDFTTLVGNTGAAHIGLVLADVLDSAEAGQLIALVSLADGVDVLILRTTDALARFRSRRVATVRDVVAGGDDSLSYQTYLTWRGLLRREPPRRPDPFRPESPSAHRGREWKYGFIGSRCVACSTLHLPSQRVCVNCHAVDQMDDECVSGKRGRIATFTVDRLAFSLNPPVVVAVVDFDGGGRFQCEMTDVDPSTVAIGQEVEMTFRRLYTSGDVHNYFWKARPARAAAQA